MNLEDLIDENGLQQDEWSLTKPKFGVDNQLEVIGWSGRHGSGKLYILKCFVCSQDPELFGEGYFKSLKGNLLKAIVSCGCSNNTRWSKEQFRVICERKSKELGYTFLDFEGAWSGAGTKVRMLCDKHGEWAGGSINGLTNANAGCQMCAYIIRATSRTKPDDVMKDSFFASGAFHPETKFWRSDKKTKQGTKVYWHVHCPVCGASYESKSDNLRGGQQSCGCSKHRQQEAYINLIVDENKLAVAIKFGISRDSKKRAIEQDRASSYEICQYAVYQFPTVKSCKQAERDCKQELECGIVLRRDMRDGWSETTWVYNLERIIEIYERNGGIIHEG